MSALVRDESGTTLETATASYQRAVASAFRYIAALVAAKAKRRAVLGDIERREMRKAATNETQTQGTSTREIDRERTINTRLSLKV